MKTRLLNIWDRASGSFWFLPALLVLSAAVLGVLLPALEQSRFGRSAQSLWLGTTPEGARTVLSAIAGAMITVAGVAFSVTMVTLSIASSQFGSRVLRQRMRNRATQLALGTFLGTSVFCFLVLRTVQGTGTIAFVPHLSVTVGIGMAVASVFVLIYFIHDVAEGVQAPHVVARLASDLNDSIERLYPDRMGQGDPELDDAEQNDGAPWTDRPGRSVESSQEGYLQGIDGDSLLETARDDDLVIELHVRPGDFVTTGDPIANLWGEMDEFDRLARQVNGALVVGNMRTPRQDVDCAIHELAQLTIRALSPGINDPFTAINGIDRLSAALGRFAQRKIPSKYRADQSGRLRVVADRVTFPETLAAAFNQIRQHARSTPPVGVRLLEGLESIARSVRRQPDRDAILQQATLVLETYQDGDQLEADLQAIRRQFDRVRSVLHEKSTDDTGGAEDPEPTSNGRRESSSQDDSHAASPPPATGEVNG